MVISVCVTLCVIHNDTLANERGRRITPLMNIDCHSLEDVHVGFLDVLPAPATLGVRIAA